MAGAPITTISIPVKGGALEGDLRSGDKRLAPLILLHGWTLDRRMWSPQLERLETPRTIIAIDRRGFGRSSAPPDLTKEAADVSAIADHLGASQAIVVGMSQSGRVAADFAVHYPQRIAGLILQGARLGGTAPEIPIQDYAELARTGHLDEMKKDWRRHDLMTSGAGAADALVDRMLTDYQGRDLMAEISVAPDFDHAALETLTVPALIITGANDTVQRRDVADEVARTMPNATRVEIKSAGHLCNLCSPEAFNKIVSEFLKGVPA